MTIRIQFEYLRKHMSMTDSQGTLEITRKVKQKFGNDANHFFFPTVYHYRSFLNCVPKTLQHQFGYNENNKNDTEWGKEPFKTCRTLTVNYTKLEDLHGNKYECSCCDPSFFVITDDNANTIKVGSNPIDHEELIYNRILYEYFRRASIIDRNESFSAYYNTKHVNEFKTHLEKELEISNMFEDPNNRFE